MNKLNKKFVTLLTVIILVFSCSLSAEEQTIPLAKAKVDLNDSASLQRGAQLYMNYCSGCHSLRYIRYQGMAQDLGIVDKEGNVLEDAVKKDLMFVGDKMTDTIMSSMTPEEGAKWFGIAPPDLSLVARRRSPDWIFTYLRSFYKDEKRPWGVNNMLYPDVAMPHALLALQGIVERESDHLEVKDPGQLKPEEYDRAVLDLVNFLTYAGEPHQEKRKHLGVFVLLFLGVFLLFAWLLKREYWKDVH